MAEREIARLEPAEVAQHLGLAVVGVENRMGQKIGGAIFDFRFATGRGRARQDDAVFAEDAEERLDVLRRGRFIERNPDAVRAERRADCNFVARRGGGIRRSLCFPRSTRMVSKKSWWASP